MRHAHSKMRDFVLLARLIGHQSKMILFESRWWLLGIVLFLALRCSAIAALHGRI
jgi:hypothetical protein